MNFGIFIIFDKSSEEYGLPFVQPTIKALKRNCAIDLLHTSDLIIKDLQVFEVGQYDRQNGVIETYGKQEYIPVLSGEEILQEVKECRNILETAFEEVEKEDVSRETSEPVKEDK